MAPFGYNNLQNYASEKENRAPESVPCFSSIIVAKLKLPHRFPMHRQ